MLSLCELIMILFTNEELAMKKNLEEEKIEENVQPEETNSPVEEKKKEEKPVQEEILVLSKEEPEKPFDEVVEEGRQELYRRFKKVNLMSTILMIVAAGAFVAAFILMTQGDWGQIAAWVVVGVTVVGLALYYVLSRRVQKAKDPSKQYFFKFWEVTNNFIFNQDGFEECRINLAQKYSLEDIMAERVY